MVLTYRSRFPCLNTNSVASLFFQGQSTIVEQIKKSYSTNDLRVRDGRDSVDGGLPYIDDSDDEFGR